MPRTKDGQQEDIHEAVLSAARRANGRSPLDRKPDSVGGVEDEDGRKRDNTPHSRGCKTEKRVATGGQDESCKPQAPAIGWLLAGRNKVLISMNYFVYVDIGAVSILL